MGSLHVKYADVLSGIEPITMKTQICGDPYDFLYSPMIFLKNERHIDLV